MMRNVSDLVRHVRQLASMLISLSVDAVGYLGLCLRPSPALAAENLFLRKQLALYEERQVKPRRATDAIRLAMVWLSYWFDWRSALRIVKPETFIGWHRQGFRLFWRWKSKRGRPALPKDLRALIRRMALENPTWGQERLATSCGSSLAYRCHRGPCASTCRTTASVAQASGVKLNAGPPLSAIMPKGYWRVTFAWQSLRPFICSMCLW